MVKTKQEEHVDDIFLTDDEEEDSQENKYLTFRIGNEIYGVAISTVTQIIEMQKITVVPDMPGYIKGVINLRGQVIPIMDLRLRFGMEERDYDDRTCTIIVNIDGRSIGFVVDTVLEVVDIPDKDIEPPPEFKSASGHDRYISGIGKVGEEVKILLDAGRVIHEAELHDIVSKAEKK
jgi:purine-binding chemotaxis protein CheW